MKPSEAIEILDRFKCENKYIEYMAKEGFVDLAEAFTEENQTLDYAIELAKRDEAIKPTFYTSRNICCSICGNKYMPKVWKFCPECGQRLDWSDDK